MKLAVIGDVHLIADNDPYKRLQRQRDFFKAAWPSLVQLLRKVDQERQDLVVMLGDIVDWFSAENMAYALDVLSGLSTPWVMVPGNHDTCFPPGGTDQDRYEMIDDRSHRPHWVSQGVDLSSRVVDVDGIRLLLMDNAMSDVFNDSDVWLSDALRSGSTNLLFTHVPIDTPETREYIISVEPWRPLQKYVMSGAPRLFADVISQRAAHLFSGHLHFSGELRLRSTQVHLCRMGITQGNVPAEATIVEGGLDSIRTRTLRVELV